MLKYNYLKIGFLLVLTGFIFFMIQVQRKLLMKGYLLKKECYMAYHRFGKYIVKPKRRLLMVLGM